MNQIEMTLVFKPKNRFEEIKATIIRCRNEGFEIPSLEKAALDMGVAIGTGMLSNEQHEQLYSIQESLLWYVYRKYRTNKKMFEVTKNRKQINQCVENIINFQIGDSYRPVFF